jgi:hypothetical protein
MGCSQVLCTRFAVSHQRSCNLYIFADKKQLFHFAQHMAYLYGHIDTILSTKTFGPNKRYEFLVQENEFTDHLKKEISSLGTYNMVLNRECLTQNFSIQN